MTDRREPVISGSSPRWEKRGRVFVPSGRREWSISHAQLPTVDVLNEQRLRVYFGTRDRRNRTVTTYLETDAANPLQILTESDRPVLDLGELGCFDDCGAMPSWIVQHDGLKYLFYIGWAACASVPYRNAIGLAVSDDSGRTFQRVFEGPILDRTRDEPHFCGSSCVLIENGIWRMWYMAALRWVEIDGRPEPVYHLRYAESMDGIEWSRSPHACIDLRSPEEGGIVRASVIKDRDVYKMWYCYRGIRDYRTNPRHSYRIGYAESTDGLQWQRLDHLAGIDVSSHGWDSTMLAYPFVYLLNGCKHMMYNGNGFGHSGFGYALMTT